ncbi:MAG: hypothetical protein ACOY40_11375 [Bacillota bacterium]
MASSESFYPPETEYQIPACQHFEEAIRIALAGEREAAEFYARIGGGTQRGR